MVSTSHTHTKNWILIDVVGDSSKLPGPILVPKKGAWAMEKDAPAMGKGTRATDEGEKATENVTRATKKGALVTEKGAWAKEKGEQVTEKAARATKNTAKGMYAGYKIKNLVLAAATNPMPVLFERGGNGARTGVRNSIVPVFETVLFPAALARNKKE